MDQFDHPSFSTQIPHSSQFIESSLSATLLGSISQKKRGEAFSADEDMHLVSSWLNISLDPVQGTYQTHQSFWARVWGYFHKYKNFESERDEKSLMQRWSKIQQATNKFHGCFSQIENRQQSGANEQDKALYKEMFKTKFTFEHCWNILRHHPKWLTDNQAKREKKKGISASSPGISSSSTAKTPINLDENDNGDTNFVDLERPLRKKSEKRKIREKNSDPLVTILEEMRADKKEERARKTYMNEKKYLLEKEMVEIEKRKADLEELREEEKIMRMETSGMPSHLQKYYYHRQMEILEKKK
ncbi:NAM-associated domain-containing protein [Citrus sinensis]|uniref:No apical meristem-associated C-terminal domain-containing protein n=1 Tax=Citrus clementina TaxID=85681 RepID=V4U4B8_CITCL|nr:glutathione S-transferase T3 [Citrus x clementina]XP_015382981.2 glutathione S-transferase T3-like [Citrus sinensis]ESR60742.1 hypothetical protein CICLE_v10018206mg [Citrus x clementina]KAH9744633.1 NAM-associated domain-containing protein [Citrus sinensis]